jgi:hypothetical protein
MMKPIDGEPDKTPTSDAGIDFPGLLCSLMDQTEGRASGLWRIEPDRLELVCFAGCATLAPAVATAFEEATRVVPLDRAELSIVRAARSGEVVEAEAVSWNRETGSGYWLRAFGAARSIAVPVFSIGVPERPWGVLSLAVNGAAAAESIAARIRIGFRRCLEASPSQVVATPLDQNR